MKLSQMNEYKEYMFSLISKEYTKAEQALDYCIRLAKKEGDIAMLSYLTQKMGDIYFLRGLPNKALDFYHDAEMISDGAPMLKYFFAIFIADRLHEYQDAISKCQEVIDHVSSTDWAKADDEPDMNYYLTQCYALQGYIYALLEDFENALTFIEKLLKIEFTYTLNYDLKLCESLKANGYYSNVKPYLQSLIEKVESSVDHEKYTDYINSIRQLLMPPS